MKTVDVISEAKRLFNETWDLLDKKDRTAEDDMLMLHKAHTSCYLWREANKPVNNARGEWQVSRVYAALKFGEPALLSGQRSLDICLNNNITGLDLAFGHEAVARAHAVLGNKARSDEHKALGLAAAETIADDADKKYTIGELENIS